MALGLLLAFLCDKARGSNRKDREAKQKEIAKKATENAMRAVMQAVANESITVSLRWSEWLFLTGILSVVTVIIWRCVFSLWEKTDIVLAVFLGTWGLIFSISPAKLLTLAITTLRRGYILRMDRDGISHCSLPMIAWEHVHGIDLREVHDGRGTHWHLVLTLGRTYFDQARFSPWYRFLHSAVLRISQREQTIIIPCAFLDMHHDVLLQGARSMASKAKASAIPFVKEMEAISSAEIGKIHHSQENLRQRAK
jgi:hypothetical protein